MKRKSNFIKYKLWKDKLKRITTSMLIFSCLFTVNSVQSSTAQTHIENDLLIKATFIYNVAKFTRWPKNIWDERNESLNICTIGRDSLIDELERLKEKIIKDHPVTLLPLKSTKTIKNCHLLYIASSEKKHYEDIIESIKGEPILTISELPNFVRSKGMIELYRGKNQTHLIVNLEVARKAGLVFSSRLLSLAVVITREEPI